MPILKASTPMYLSVLTATVCTTSTQTVDGLNLSSKMYDGHKAFEKYSQAQTAFDRGNRAGYLQPGQQQPYATRPRSDSNASDSTNSGDPSSDHSKSNGNPSSHSLRSLASDPSSLERIPSALIDSTTPSPLDSDINDISESSRDSSAPNSPRSTSSASNFSVNDQLKRVNLHSLQSKTLDELLKYRTSYMDRLKQEDDKLNRLKFESGNIFNTEETLELYEKMDRFLGGHCKNLLRVRRHIDSTSYDSDWNELRDYFKSYTELRLGEANKNLSDCEQLMSFMEKISNDGVPRFAEDDKGHFWERIRNKSSNTTVTDNLPNYNRINSLLESFRTYMHKIVALDLGVRGKCRDEMRSAVANSINITNLKNQIQNQPKFNQLHLPHVCEHGIVSPDEFKIYSTIQHNIFFLEYNIFEVNEMIKQKQVDGDDSSLDTLISGARDWLGDNFPSYFYAGRGKNVSNSLKESESNTAYAIYDHDLTPEEVRDDFQRAFNKGDLHPTQLKENYPKLYKVKKAIEHTSTKSSCGGWCDDDSEECDVGSEEVESHQTKEVRKLKVNMRSCMSTYNNFKNGTGSCLGRFVSASEGQNCISRERSSNFETGNCLGRDRSSNFETGNCLGRDRSSNFETGICLGRDRSFANSTVAGSCGGRERSFTNSTVAGSCGGRERSFTNSTVAGSCGGRERSFTNSTVAGSCGGRERSGNNLGEDQKTRSRDGKGRDCSFPRLNRICGGLLDTITSIGLGMM